MRTVYIDSDFKCHVADDGTRKAVEIDFFDGKCEQFVEGYCYDTRNGYVQIYPFLPFGELDSAQREYEKQLLSQYEAFFDELYREVSIG